jgi:hypothetical protein
MTVITNGALNPEVVQFQVITGVDPVSYVLSANVHRRHLSTSGKRELAGNLLLMFPNKSDRQIAELVGISKNTAKSVRDELAGRGQIDHVKIRIDTKGRRQPATKPPKELPTAMPAPPATPEVKDKAAIAAATVNQLAPAELAAFLCGLKSAAKRALQRQTEIDEIAKLSGEIQSLLTNILRAPDNVDGIQKRTARILQLTGSATKSRSIVVRSVGSRVLDAAVAVEAAQ